MPDAANLDHHGIHCERQACLLAGLHENKHVKEAEDQGDRIWEDVSREWKLFVKLFDNEPLQVSGTLSVGALSH